MKFQRTSVGLDVHARSVVACALDGDTGEVFQRRLTPDHGEIVAWLGDLPGPVAVTYEAGPTGFGLARALTAAGISCEVAAPSKLIRPAGDRVKTDARDAAHLARLLHLGQITAVTVPSAEPGSSPGSGARPRGLPRGSDDRPTPGLETASPPRHRLFRRKRLDRHDTNSGYAPSGSTTRHLQLSYEAAFDAMLACRGSA